MKVRNILIGLLVVLMAFVFISCEDEPEPQPKPNPSPSNGEIYQIQITEGVDKDYYNRDKIKLVWKEEIYEGDTITLKYRSERTINQWDIRDGDSALWVYEKYLNGLETPVLGDDGWYTFSYTFGDGITKKGEAADISYPYTNGFGIYFRGNFVTTDIFEIKDIMLNGQPLEVTSDNITSKAALTDPAVDFNWSQKNYAVLFATGTPGEVDKTPIAEKVPAGGTVTGAPIAKEGYTLTIYNDSAHTEIFDQTQPINEEKIFYYEYVGVPRTVSFVTGTEDVIEDIIVPNGDLLTLPADPENGGFEFAGWYLDPGYTEKFVAASTPITGNTTLYAKWALHVWTVTIDLDDGSAASVIQVEEGNTVLDSEIPDVPIIPGVYFGGWHEFAEEVLADDEFDFTAAVTADHVVKAKWIEPTTLVKMVAVRGGGDSADKFILDWTGDPGKLAKEGDIISFKFRSTASIEQYSVRGTKKWAYQRSVSDPTLLAYEVGDDGWISVAYQFPADGASYDDKGGTIAYGEDGLKFRFDLRSTSGIAIGDICEIKGLAFNGEPLEVVALHGDCVADDFDADVVPYDWPATVNVTINYDNGGEADERTGVVAAAFGARAFDLLEDTTKGSLVFDGWYSNEECTEAFDSKTAITEPITIYGKWISAFAVSIHKNNGEADKVLYVGQYAPMESPGVGNPGYYLEGWYTDEGLTSAWDFADNVTEDMNLYAKWTSANNYYTLTAPEEMSRFTLRYKGNGSGLDINPQKGDVLAFKYKSNVALDSIILRDRNQSSSYKFAYYDDLSDFTSVEADANGFYSFKIVFDADVTYPCDGFCLELFIDGTKLQPGNTLDLSGFSFNGVELEISGSSDSKGPYGSPKASVSGPTSLL